MFQALVQALSRYSSPASVGPLWGNFEMKLYLVEMVSQYHVPEDHGHGYYNAAHTETLRQHGALIVAENGDAAIAEFKQDNPILAWGGGSPVATRQNPQYREY
mgnify:CR=1 FL=1